MPHTNVIHDILSITGLPKKDKLSFLMSLDSYNSKAILKSEKSKSNIPHCDLKIVSFQGNILKNFANCFLKLKPTKGALLC